MPKAPAPSLPKAARPKHAASWDPWNSSSTGHQRAEQRPPSRWRDARTELLNTQLRGKPTTQSTQATTASNSVVDMLRRPGLMKTSSFVSEGEEDSRGIFSGTTVYVNGSTFPLISDHKLKQVLAGHGAQMALHLARRRVTHVILGSGLAGGKADKEMRRMRGCGVYFVGAEWVVESVKAGKRLSEARFAKGPTGQASVYNKFSS